MQRVHLWRGFEPTFPNYMTAFRMGAGVAVFSVVSIDWLLQAGSIRAVDAAVVLMFLGAVSDMDGTVARRTNRVSKWGTYWDPIADAILAGSAAASIYLFKQHTELEVAILFLIIGRESWRPLARRVNATDDAPKFEFEKTKAVVYFAACLIVLARGSHLEMWWDASLPFSWVTMGTAVTVFAGAVMAYAYYGTREREKKWRKRKKRQIKAIGKKARSHVSSKMPSLKKVKEKIAR